MANDLLSLALQGGSAGAVIYGLAVIVRTLAKRPLFRADAADKLNDSALEWVRQIQDEARQARVEADAARREAAEARREANDARRAADDAAREARVLKTAILSPYASLEGLRAMVSDGPGNGLVRVPRDVG